jgi:predicted secreted protein
MLTAIFAVAVIIGAVTAFRRNPSYTGRSLLISIPIVLLTIAAVIGLIIAAVDFANGRSPAVIIATMASAILFGSFFLIYIIYTFSTPKDAKLTHTLPPGTKLVHVHRQKVYHWAKVAAVLLLVCGALYLLLPGNPGFIALMVGTFILAISALLLPILYFTSRMMDVSLTALQVDPWVHWTYTPEQWAQWSEVQVGRLQATPSTFILKRDWHKLAWMFATIAVGVYLIAPGGLLWKTAYLLFIALISTVIGTSTARGDRSAPGKLRAHLRTVAPEVFFGRDGLFANGALTLWRSTDTFLNAAAIDDRAPRSLLFRFEKDVPNPYGPLNVVPINQAVLIPPDGDRDLPTLQQHLTERCPSAQITLA